jgi:hypothetical protein
MRIEAVSRFVVHMAESIAAISLLEPACVLSFLVMLAADLPEQGRGVSATAISSVWPLLSAAM